jgi:hypothetical protein
LKTKLPRTIFIALLFAVAFSARQVSAQQDGGAVLSIRFADGSSRFHVGEVIPLELSFNAALPDAYQYSTANYDRSGRLDMERFHVTPSGRDPLLDYYSSMQVMVMGSLSSSGVLAGAPYVIHDQLNEWVAPDKPGHYSVFVTSGRVNHAGPETYEPMTLQSNSLEFDVVEADPAWQQETLRIAISTLDDKSTTPEQKAAAVRVLRFLDSPGSIHELVRLLGTHAERGHWDEMAGLAGSRFQKLVVSELERGIDSPDVALTQDYLYIFPKLKQMLEQPALPPYPQKDAAQQKIWQAASNAHNKQFNELADALCEKAAALAPGKSPAARVETVTTLLMRPTREPGTARPLANIPVDEVASTFLNISGDAQANLLSGFWARLKIPAMAEPLETIAREPDLKLQMLRDLVIRRLYDLNPKAATPIILDEIAHPHVDNGMFTVNSETLGMLPNETLPQFDEILAARLAQKESRTHGLDAQLVARYSTSAILAKVKATYESELGQWDCITEDGFVLYFLRADSDYGVKRLAVAPSSCMTNSLPAVIKMHRWSEVEPGIIARLNGTDLNREGQAAATLATYGSAQSEAAVWDRLRRFHAQWVDHADELVYRPDMPREANEALTLHGALFQAIGTSKAWFLTDEKITALESLAVGWERDSLKQWRWTSPVGLSVYLQDGRTAWSIKQVTASDLPSLLAKIAQYPAGTEFNLDIFGTNERTAPIIDALYDVAAKHGLQINLPPNAQ